MNKVQTIAIMAAHLQAAYITRDELGNANRIAGLATRLYEAVEANVKEEEPPSRDLCGKRIPVDPEDDDPPKRERVCRYLKGHPGPCSDVT